MEKINIAELLRDCPKGIELDCVMCNNPIELEGVVGDDAGYPIKAVGKDGFHHAFTSYGASYNHDDAKCVIFPKGKNTWEGFVPPCQFEDGDIVYIKTNGYYHNEFIMIFKEIKNDHIHKHACFAYKVLYTNPNAVCHLVDIEEIRIATEEEKAELFKAIKENGYKWNEETKKLEKVYKYPQTFEECCTVLGLTELGIIGGYRHGLLTQFRNLLICRDAYWKIADDWKFNFEEKCYYLCNEYHEIQDFNGVCDCNAVLAFPTAEMRDAFYDNFEELIKECKSLL